MFFVLLPWTCSWWFDHRLFLCKTRSYRVQIILPCQSVRLFPFVFETSPGKSSNHRFIVFFPAKIRESWTSFPDLDAVITALRCLLWLPKDIWRTSWFLSDATNPFCFSETFITACVSLGFQMRCPSSKILGLPFPHSCSAAAKVLKRSRFSAAIFAPFLFAIFRYVISRCLALKLRIQTSPGYPFREHDWPLLYTSAPIAFSVFIDTANLWFATSSKLSTMTHSSLN